MGTGEITSSDKAQPAKWTFTLGAPGRSGVAGNTGSSTDGHRAARHQVTGALVVTLGLSSVVSGAVPVSSAAPAEQYVRTESGKVRCGVQPGRVACQYLSGFPQAPVDPGLPCPPPPGSYFICGGPGTHWDIANVTPGGAFSWMSANLATAGSADPQNDVVLNYGQSYDVQGWTIQPSFDGTRFTNDSTGHGMFVSVENVYAF